MPKFPLDSIDLKILNIIQGAARISNTELAERVGLSPSPCWRRVRAWKNQGYPALVTLVNADAVGLPNNVFATVTLEKQVEGAWSALKPRWLPARGDGVLSDDRRI
ncbi:MAG: hypothetical protein CM1200mP41_03810 [Gammaproteobacteria bacterium]|nr:MAG: hypothetical protein CM1200mP41_03810 [Gammaproteobacteria bacterium]